MMKDAFYFMFKALSALEIFAFLPRRFVHVGKRLDKKIMVNFKIDDVTDWITDNYNSHIIQYLKNLKQLGNETWSVNKI